MMPYTLYSEFMGICMLLLEAIPNHERWDINGQAIQLCFSDRQDKSYCYNCFLSVCKILCLDAFVGSSPIPPFSGSCILIPL